MKKITLFAAAVLVAVGLASCGKSTPKANLKSDVDSLSYAIGMTQSNGLKEYLVGNLGIDTAYIDEFIKGLNEGANAGDDKRKAAYYAGIQIGQQINNQLVKGINHELFGEDSTKTISLKNFMAGFISGTTGKNSLMSISKAQEVTNTKMNEIREKSLESTYGAYKKQNEAFAVKYSKGADVKKLAHGVCYKVIKEGKGELPTKSSVVEITYEGKTIDGKVFDKSDKPTEFPVGQVIPGFTEALTHMPVGSVWEVVIPQDQAYGTRDTGGQIKPFSTLIFKIELLGIKKGEPQAQAGGQQLTPEQQAQIEAAMKAAQARGKR